MRKIIKDIKFRRRRESVTDYKKRLGLVKGGADRVVVRKTNRRIIGQVVRYGPSGDRVLAYADSSELSGVKWPGRANRPTAYLTGMLLARKAAKAGSAKGVHVLDIGIASPVAGSIPFVFAKGCVDGGLNINGTFRLEEKSYNMSDTKYIEEMKSKDSARYNRLFSSYIEKGFDPAGLARAFAEAKDKLMKE